MVNANELRLGNKIQVNTPGTKSLQVAEVLKIHPDEIRVENSAGPDFSVQPSEISGIPLNSDNIKSCGFFLQSENSRSYYKAPVTIINDSDGWHLTVNEWHIGKNMHYLHQLQNLYFALCLEELAVND